LLVANVGTATGLAATVGAGQVEHAAAGVERRQLDQEMRRLAVDIAARGANLVVGGQQVGSDMIPPDAHVHLISSMSELTAFARGLRSAQADHVNVRG